MPPTLCLEKTQIRPNTPLVVRQRPELTKLLQRKNPFQVPPVLSGKKSRIIDRRSSIDDILAKSSRKRRCPKKRSSNPRKRTPIYILTMDEIHKNECLSASLGALSRFVSQTGIRKVDPAPKKKPFFKEVDLFSPTFPGPFQVIERSFFHHSECPIEHMARVEGIDTNLTKNDDLLLFSTWSTSPGSNLNDDLNMIEPSFSFAEFDSPFNFGEIEELVGGYSFL